MNFNLDCAEPYPDMTRNAHMCRHVIENKRNVNCGWIHITSEAAGCKWLHTRSTDESCMLKYVRHIILATVPSLYMKQTLHILESLPKI